MAQPDDRCGRCGHAYADHEEGRHGVHPCDWQSHDYVQNQRGTHCTCFAFYPIGGRCPVFGMMGQRRKP